MATDIFIVVGALALDLLLGEPPNVFHPVAWLGKGISLLDKVAPNKGRVAQLLFGTGMATLAPLLYAAIGMIALYLLYRLSPWVSLAGAVLLLKSTFAVRALDRPARQVEYGLTKAALETSRAALPSLVRRDAAQLSPTLMASAAVESVAENTTDSFVAPWFYFALFGIAGALAYRAVNTLDSMVGYHGKYEYLGKASARLDDMLNLIPARLSALMIAIGAAFSKGSPKGALTTMWKQRNATESPNAGWTMGAMAGALGVALEKQGYYKLGEPTKSLDAHSIAQARRIMYAVAAQGLILTIVLILLRYEAIIIFTR